ncbi:MAG: CehA/McbA family metallohydrolase [Eubacteriales bacterium]|nr:CehA/McbA family metallohydrolase [Eubacteriales bacterium]
MLIRQAAFENAGKLLKGALHCHTTRSDGKGTPEEVIRLHAQNGYQFMAITDHRYYNYTNFAPDVPMTLLGGMEFDNHFDEDADFHWGDGFRCFHIVSVGPSPEEGNGFEQDFRCASGTAKDQQAFQPYLDWLHENNNLTVYCHPEWSSTPARYFDQMKGNFAMEIWNSGCAMENAMDTNAAYWDELLGQGQRIFGVASDDGHAMEQHCRGWVMVNAANDRLSILKALKAGAFYSSCGPQLTDFYVQDGKVVVECSPCAQVRLLCDRHPAMMMRDAENGITHAAWDIPTAAYPYVRAEVMDAQGRRAWSNPIFLR